jgi:hypothetical protein
VDAAPNGHAHGNRFNLQIAGGVSSTQGDKPLNLSMRLAPVKCLASAQAIKDKAVVKDGILQAAFVEAGLGVPVTVSIDAATGRLLDLRCEARTNGMEFSLQLRTEAGAYQRLAGQLAAETASWKDDYIKDFGYSSWTGFMLSDLLESGLLESGMVSNRVAADSVQRAQELVAAARQIRLAVAQLKKVAGKEDLIQCLMPIEQQLASLKRAEGDTNAGFTLPMTQLTQSQMQAMMALIGGWIIDKADDFWQRDSWPWTLTREAAFTLAGQSKYTQTELEKLLVSNAVGPLGSGAAGALVAKINAPLSEKFVRRSLDQLTVPDLQKDLTMLLAPDNLAGRILQNVLTGFSRLKDPELDALAAIVGGGSTNFFRETAQVLRSGTNVPPAQALMPALQRHWEPLLKPRLEAELKDLLAKVGLPNTPESAFKRAVFIRQNSNKPEDLKTALELLQQSADQGYGKAQFQLASLYEKGDGMPRDFALARKWYERAANNKVPHSRCRLADFYFNGEGVERNVETAMNYLASEASNNCTGAQVRLAQCLEQQSRITEALVWYRHAGTNGNSTAQMALGDRLTDALSCPVDNAEAYFWYSVAAERGNRVAVVSARRLKANKLSAEQIKAIDPEVSRLVGKIEEAARNDSK